MSSIINYTVIRDELLDKCELGTQTTYTILYVL